MSAYSDMIKKNPALGGKKQTPTEAVWTPPSQKKDGKKFGKRGKKK